jgi:transcriptional regulator with XRE-family HTH domain
LKDLQKITNKNNITMTALPINLRSRRKKMGWTQEQAAEKLSKAFGKKIPRTTYNAFENQKVNPCVDILPAIVEVFLIDDLYLFLTKCQDS